MFEFFISLIIEIIFELALEGLCFLIYFVGKKLYKALRKVARSIRSLSENLQHADA